MDGGTGVFPREISKLERLKKKLRSGRLRKRQVLTVSRSLKTSGRKLNIFTRGRGRESIRRLFTFLLKQRKKKLKYLMNIRDING